MRAQHLLTILVTPLAACLADGELDTAATRAAGGTYEDAGAHEDKDAGEKMDAGEKPDGGEEQPSGCWITGGGHIGDEENRPGAGRADQDSFGGNAMTMRDGSVRGQWQNTTHLGDVFHGQVTFIRCWRDELGGPEVPQAIPNNAEFGGTGTWNHLDGYTFLVHITDRAEGGSHADTYEIEIRDPSGTVVYSQSDTIDGGNLQIHPPNAGHP